MAWTFDDALRGVIVIDRNDEWGTYQLKIGKTPAQISAYHSSRMWWDDAPYALHNAVSGISEHYEQAVKAGHQPSEDWLEPNPRFKAF